MATRGEVIVRVQWADPERSGQRTLRLRARSLEHACRRIAAGYGDVVEETAADSPAVEPRATRATRPRSTRAANGNGHPPGAHADSCAGGDGHAGTPSCALVEATVEWVGDVPAGHLLPALTLVRARTGQRQVILRLNGSHEFGVGTRLYLSGLNGSQSLFDAELVSGAGKSPFFFEVHAWRV